MILDYLLYISVGNSLILKLFTDKRLEHDENRLISLYYNEF